jgi:hypothetical protein
MHLTYHLPRPRSSHPVLGGMLLAACAFLLGARTSEAHVLDAAVATPDCGTSTIQLHFTGSLMENGPFSIPYTIKFNCTDGGPAIPPISDTASGTVANATPGGTDGTFDITATQAAALAGRTCLVSGTATLSQGGVQYNTVAITDSGGATEIPLECVPPPRVTGCTPGYWKQDQHFDSWVGYAPGDSFEAVFGRDVPGTPSLLDALKLGGGGLNALMRHATAALLNASNPDVSSPYSVSDVIALFQQAFDSGKYEATKDTFAGLNETGCPLN